MNKGPIVAACIGLLFGASASAARGALTIKEAENLVTVYLVSRGGNAPELPGFGYDEGRVKTNPRFYSFSATWNNPGPGSVVVGNFGVDSLTGDVWDGGACEIPVSTHKLRAAQRKLREKIGLSKNRYDKLRRQIKPCGWW